jgi:hypothetical protein
MTDLARLVIAVDSTGLVKGEAALRELGAQAQRTGAAADAAGDRMTGMGAAAGAAAGAQARLARSTTMAAGATGNLVAQLNDIGMMLAAGQNPLQLAIQQGTQITQVIGPMGAAGAAKALGAAFVGMLSPINLITIGAIAAGAAMVNWLTSSNEEAVTLDDAIGRIDDSIKALTDAAEITLEDLREKYGAVTAEVEALIDAQEKLAQAQAIRDAATALGALRDQLGEGLFATATGDAAEIFETIPRFAGRYIQQLEEIAQLDSFAAQADALAELRSELGVTAGNVESMTDKQYAFWRSLVTTEDAFRQLARASDQAEMADGIDSATDSAGRLSGAMRTVADYAIDAQTAIANLAGVEPGAGWLSHAIYNASSLANQLWNGVKAMEAYRLAAASAPAMGGPGTFPPSGMPGAPAVGPGGARPDAADFLGLTQQRAAVINAQQAISRYSAEMDAAAAAADGLGSSAGSAGRAAEDAADRALTATEAFNKGMQAAAMTAEDLGTAKANALVGGIEGISQAFGTFVSTGLRDFKGFVRSVLSSFQRMIADMIATATQNKILLSLGFAAPTGASAATGAITGGGGFMSMLSGVGGAMFSGATSWLGGIGSGLSALSGATSGLTGFATALGAIAAPLAALGLVFSAFRGSTKLVDQGFRLMADGADLLVTQFKETEKRRFFGLVKKKKTTEGAASDEIADPLQAAYSDVQGTILDMADSLGKGSSALKNFSYTVKLSTKGMSNDEAAQALANELDKMSDKMAKAVLGGTKFVRSGETTTEALKRLSGSLSAANVAMKALGLPLFNVSVSGAAAASAMVDVLGGIEGFNRATAFYLQNFYSLEEQRNAMSREFAAAVKDMGLAVPKTKEEFKALVDELTKAGRMEDAATLIGLAPLFVDLQTLKDRIKELGDASTLSSEELAKLNKAESEKDSLQRRYLELTGQTAKLRKLELAELEPANRALQERIWAIEDEQRVEAKRGDLQRRIYELTGNTAALRKLELAALDPANRALQRQVWALEDAQKALDDLTTDGFGSLFEYERAVGLAKGKMAQIGAGSGNVLDMVANAIGSFMTGHGGGASSSPIRPPIETRGANKASAPAREQKRAGGSDNDAMLIELRAIKTLHSAVLHRVTALDMKIRKWDGDGLPETRTA